ncbi:peptidase M10 [Streptomyces sp. NPDC050504]|uniref:peptidase M10 n=1 Tax=Streptomyces sp. NPDC050504 TaxID=3365618 RepID=UPI0037BE12D2
MAGANPKLIGRSIIAFALATTLSTIAGSAQAETPGTDVCMLEDGDLAVDDLPDGSSVIKCDAVGRVVTYDGTGVTVPEPGTTVSVHALSADGTTHGFTLEVAVDGTVSYDLADGAADASVAGSDVPDALSTPVRTPGDLSQESETVDADASDTSAGPEVPAVEAAGSPAACSDSAYKTDDLKEYGTYNWYLGDGGLPGGLSQTAAKWAFWDAIDNITESYDDCGLGDAVDAKSNYLGIGSFEADINTRGQCTARDGVSTWDAGDIKDTAVATTCTWSWPMLGVKNDLREADVRFNTHDFDFTNTVTSGCSGKYDIRSVGTHEAGHVFGMGHVGAGHGNLTMYTNSIMCSTKARTLGKGDVLGLRSVY